MQLLQKVIPAFAYDFIFIFGICATPLSPAMQYTEDRSHPRGVTILSGIQLPRQ